MLIDDLAGGKFRTLSLGNTPKENSKYSIFIQFDEDAPKELYQNLKVGEQFTLTLNGPGPTSVFTFTDNVTGKQFKIFAK
jgi:hypothetical protein